MNSSFVMASAVSGGLSSASEVFGLSSIIMGNSGVVAGSSHLVLVPASGVRGTSSST